MTLPDIFFAAICMVMIVSALMAVSLKNVFYNALSLILCLFCVACVFIYLNSEFLAILEIIIYIGAISITIIFAIMLSRPMFQKYEKRSLAKILRSLLVGALLFFGIFKILKKSGWPLASIDGDYSMAAVGRSLLK